MARRTTLDFLKTETGSGALLAAAAILALVAANSPLAPRYFAFVEAPVTVWIAGFRETHSVLDWVKEGLMAIFFFVVGLEIKYEVLKGELANPRRLALPVLAALGGMVAPALVYLAFNLGPHGSPEGWPVPMATDIAFAIAALAIVGARLPPTLRVTLLTLAIVDDLGAVAVIATVFTDHLRWPAIGGAAAGLMLMALLGRWRGAPYLFYGACAVLVWAFTLRSGVSTSLAGVASAFMIPIGARKPGRPGVLEDFMEGLHPYVAYFILPLFAFCAAGFSVAGLGVEAVFGPVSVGVAAGLFLGKQLGVFGVVAGLVRLGLARRPTGTTWLELYGLALLCGIGFTMSLFIGELAFDDPALRAEVRLGVAAGSVLSAAAGMAVLGLAARRREAP